MRRRVKVKLGLREECLGPGGGRKGGFLQVDFCLAAGRLELVGFEGTEEFGFGAAHGLWMEVGGRRDGMG